MKLIAAFKFLANFITRILIKKESELVENLKIWKQSDEDLILLKISEKKWIERYRGEYRHRYNFLMLNEKSDIILCTDEKINPFLILKSDKAIELFSLNTEKISNNGSWLNEFKGIQFKETCI